MTQGRLPKQVDLFNDSRDFCERTLPKNSIYRLLFEHGDDIFPDDFFCDLYSHRGRNSIPGRIIATVMVLQRLEGLSDREAVERFAYDARWKYAAGGLPADHPPFVHTVLVYARARLRASSAPTRIFDAVVEIARQAGLIGTRRALDSTPLYDAVATQDTVTLIRSAIRGVLRQLDGPTEAQVRGVLKRDDRYDTPGKPVCDWDDREAREQLIDALARDGFAVLAHFDGETIDGDLREALELLATVLGQDLETDEEGRFRIARRVARDRVISTVDPQARHGHKTSSRGFDGYKGHVAIDPDSEIITATTVTSGNVGDAEAAEELLRDVLPPQQADDEDGSASEPEPSGAAAADSADARSDTPEEPSERCDDAASPRTSLKDLWLGVVGVVARLGALIGCGSDEPQAVETEGSRLLEAADAPVVAEVYGDASYGAAGLLARLDDAGIGVYTKVQPPSPPPGGRYAQDAFEIDLSARTVTCPAKQVADLRFRGNGGGYAAFGTRCAGCALREQCTTSSAGRSINVHPQFDLLERYRKQQQDPAWRQRYRATRPKVERKIAHLMRHKHGGRRARVRGRLRVEHDFSLLAAATNLGRLARLGLSRTDGGWAVAI